MKHHPLIDTHAHLCDPSFTQDLPQVLDRARSANITGILIVTEHPSECPLAIDLCQRFPNHLRCAAGLFPTHLDDASLDAFLALFNDSPSPFAAIGEVGLDYWKCQEPQDQERQRFVFERIVHTAIAHDLPLNVHSRAAGRDTLHLLLDAGAKRVHMHAFDGKAATAMPGIEAGYYFSIPTSLPRSPQKLKLLKHLPLACLLLESDSPVLGPVPQERNEPANLRPLLATVAELKHTAPEHLAEVITANTRRLYAPAFNVDPCAL